MKSVRLIVDGSALGNPGAGGWACIMQYQASERVLTGSEPESTNNRMEMLAALRGLQALKPCQVEVITEYLQRGMTQFLSRWKANGWRTSSGEPVVNRELWNELDGASARHQVSRTWVPGHGSEHPDHNRADSLARRAAMATAA